MAPGPPPVWSRVKIPGKASTTGTETGCDATPLYSTTTLVVALPETSKGTIAASVFLTE